MTATVSSSSRRRNSDFSAHRAVRFSVVQVREYNLCVASDGATTRCDIFPLVLDWAHTPQQEYKLSDYERASRRRSDTDVWRLKKNCLQAQKELEGEQEESTPVAASQDFASCTAFQLGPLQRWKRIVEVTQLSAVEVAAQEQLRFQATHKRGKKKSRKAAANPADEDDQALVQNLVKQRRFRLKLKGMMRRWMIESGLSPNDIDNNKRDNFFSALADLDVQLAADADADETSSTCSEDDLVVNDENHQDAANKTGGECPASSAAGEDYRYFM